MRLLRSVPNIGSRDPCIAGSVRLARDASGRRFTRPGPGRFNRLIAGAVGKPATAGEFLQTVNFFQSGS